MNGALGKKKSSARAGSSWQRLRAGGRRALPDRRSSAEVATCWRDRVDFRRRAARRRHAASYSRGAAVRRCPHPTRSGVPRIDSRGAGRALTAVRRRDRGLARCDALFGLATAPEGDHADERHEGARKRFYASTGTQRCTTPSTASSDTGLVSICERLDEMGASGGVASPPEMPTTGTAEIRASLRRSARNSPPIGLRASRVEQDEPRQNAFLPQIVERHAPVVETDHAMPVVLEHLGQTLADAVVILDDEDVVILFPVHEPHLKGTTLVRHLLHRACRPRRTPHGPPAQHARSPHPSATPFAIQPPPDLRSSVPGPAADPSAGAPARHRA